MKTKKNRRLEFLNLVPPEAKYILDVGCGDGNLSAHLLKEGRLIVGIDRNPRACEAAKTRLSKVFCGDIEHLDLPILPQSLDCIIFADVLDCLVDPLSLLLKYRPLLQDDGCVITSMANVRYYKVMTNLLFRGAWDYIERGGILWIHHLRFFTLQTMKELFEKAGFSIDSLERYIVASSEMKTLNVLCFQKLKELLTYQYYFRLKKQRDWVPGAFQPGRAIDDF